MTAGDDRQRGVLSPTGARYVLLIVTLTLAGAFAGQVIHNLVLGPSWASAVLKCSGRGAALFPDSAFDRALYMSRCTGPVQRREAEVSLVGSAAVLLLGLAGLWLLPRRLLRRAGPLKAVPARWQELADRVAAEMGVRRPPRLVWGAAPVREAFVLGRGGRSRVVLPRGIRLLPEAEAEAIVRHEVAHLAAGDTVLVWLTRGLWWALPPVLLAAPLVAAVQGWRLPETSPLRMLSHSFWAEYGARALVLMVVAALVTQLIMRSREHEADLAAVRGQSVALWESLLGGAQPAGRRSWLDRARANHPSHDRRLAVLRAPLTLLRPSLLDTFVVGLLAAVLLDSMDGLGNLLLSGTSWSSAPVGALSAGLFLAVGWGVAVWRDTQARGGANSGAVRWLHAALGMSVGAGLLVRLQSTGTTASGPMRGWPLLIVLPLAVMGAASLGAAFARLWSSRRGAEHIAFRDQLAVVTVNALLFGGALWLAMDFCTMLKAAFAEPVPYAALLTGPYAASSGTRAVGLVAVAAMALWAASRRARPLDSHWLPALCVAGAVVASAVTRLGYRPSAMPRDWTATWQLDVLTALCAGAVCAVALVVCRGSDGLGPALYVAPAASVLTATVLWAARFGSWRHPFDVWATVLVGGSLSGLVVVLVALAAPAGLLPAWGAGRRTVTGGAAAVTALAAIASVVALEHAGDAVLLR
ncbi:M48 family metalloprotease [Streptomyces mirabilis]|uniref:M48 family metalloprotease n=1 Tax=Streptomyces mirabilis TaxID=68239 RepID=UPI003681E676